MNKHVALFGGSFDPVHLGHVIAAGEVLRQTDCSELWFVPTHRHPEKSFETMTSATHRVAMLEGICAHHPLMHVSKCEIDISKKTGKPTYTIDTLKTLTSQHPDTMFSWVIGSDLVASLPTWAGAQHMLSYAHIVIVPVAGIKRTPLTLALGAHTIQWIDSAVLTSGTASRIIRALIKRQEPYEHLVPNQVAQYILKNKLYNI